MGCRLDGKTLAAATEGTVTEWNLPSRRAASTNLDSALGFITSLAFSPDGKTLAVGGDVCSGPFHLRSCAGLLNAATRTAIGERARRDLC